MNIKQRKYVQLAVLVAGLTCVAKANTVSIAADSGSPDSVYSISTFTTTGSDMAALGLTVVVNFSDNSQQTKSWTTISGCDSTNNCGLAFGSITGGGWTLTETGDTGRVSGVGTNPETNALNAWTLTDTSSSVAITSIELFGGPLITFDRDRATATGTDSPTGDVGTPSSALGITYWIPASNTGPFTVSVSYNSMVSVYGSPSTTCLGTNETPAFNTFSSGTGCGDEWNNLIFTISASAFDNSSTLVFFQDTDEVGSPEPTTVGLVGVGVFALVAFRKRILRRLPR